MKFYKKLSEELLIEFLKKFVVKLQKELTLDDIFPEKDA